MAARITKALRAEFDAYSAEGGKASLAQYVALKAGRAKMLANRAARIAEPSTTPVAKPTRRGKRTKVAAVVVETLPISQLLRAASGSRVDFMGGNLVVDEAGTVALIDALDSAGFAPQIVGKQTSKRRGIRTQVSLPADQIQAALAVAEGNGFRTWQPA